MGAWQENTPFCHAVRIWGWIAKRMSTSRLLEECSFYNIGTICISFEKSMIDSSNGLIDEGCAVSFHEYFHLVQNTSTIFGLWMFMNKLEIFQDYAYASRRNNDINKFNYPIKKTKTKYADAIESLERVLFENGKISFSKETTFVGFGKTISIPLISDGDKGLYAMITAEYQNEGESFEYSITARSLYEAYSKAVEYEITLPFSREQIISNYGQFEYYAVRLILEHFFPNIREKTVATILHWSLNHVMPSDFFKKIVLHLSCVYGSNLPSAQDVSKELKEFYDDNCYEMHIDLLNELKKKIDAEFKEKDNVLGPVLDDIYKLYEENFKYFSDSSKIPSLTLYPFVTTTTPMYTNACEIPIPLYKPLNEDIFFTMSKKPIGNFITLDALFFVLDKAQRGILNYVECPYYRNCTISQKGKECRKHLSKIRKNCHIGVAMKYFV